MAEPPVGTEVEIGGVTFTKTAMLADVAPDVSYPDMVAAGKRLIPPMVAAGKAAKVRLEALGWNAIGSVDPADSRVTVTAVRGDENIVMEWQKGEFVGQTYYAWATDKVWENNKPNGHDLGFDPDEIPDRDLIVYLRGMRVTWWNKLAEGTETATIGDRITIQHNYVGDQDAQPADRIITFVDRNAGGFRSFRLGALMRLG